MLGLFDRPASADCLGALWKKPAIPGLTESLKDAESEVREVARTALASIAGTGT